MNITYFSFLMATIWSSMIIILFYISRKKRKFIKYFGVINLVILYLVCGIRLLLPIEFPFVRVLGLTGIFAEIYEIIHLNEITVFGLSFTITSLLISIWLIGILIVIIRWTVQYYKAIQKIYSIKKYHRMQSEKVLSKVQNVYHRKLHVKIWQSPHVDIPMGMGVFRKTILLPEDSYTDDELYYILLHEYTHFINHDIAVKMLVHIFCCIFWWNPSVYLLKKDLDQTLEIKCDLTVIKAMDKNSKSSYLEVIIAVIDNAEKRTERKQAIPAAMLFQPDKDTAVIERFQIVMDNHLMPRKAKLFYYGWIALLCVVMGFSYLFQFQADFEPPISELSAEEEMTPENTYLLDNGDGTYTMIDLLGRTEDAVTNKKWVVDDMISQGFVVEKERRKE